MATKRILYFTANGHYLYADRRSGLALEAKFSDDELGVDEFREYLRRQPHALYYVVADLAGEDFHAEQIPFLRGSDRTAVVQRRLAQRYRDTRLAAALSLGSIESGGRRNERLLLTSFTNGQQLAPWVQALEEARARLAGVFSVPLLAPALAAKLGIQRGRALLVTANLAGLRQCFVEEGRLRFARLERTGDMSAAALAAFVRSETLRLAQYLATMRALPREEGRLQVVVVAPAGQQGVFENTLVSDGRLAFRVITSDHAARAIRLTQQPQEALDEALFLHLAARNAPREQFASSEDRRPYLIWRLQRGIAAAGALGLAGCALYGAALWLDANQIRERAALQQHEARRAAQQYERITAGFPVTQTSTENLKVTVVEFRRIAERSPLPEQAFMHVSRVLAQFPQIELEALNWEVGRPAGQLGARPKTATADPASFGKPPAQGPQAELIEVSGRVNAIQRSDYRAITAQVQRFAAALSASGYELVRTQLPFDINSDGTLTGDIGGAESGEAPHFTITVARALR
jgi:hypothetical protein